MDLEVAARAAQDLIRPSYFDQFRKFGIDTGNLTEDATSYASYADIPLDVATRLARSKKNIIKMIKEGVK